MTKLDIYGIALAVFNLDISEMNTEATEDKPISKEIFFCDKFYRNAEISCSKVYDWSFLYSFKQYTEDDLYVPLSKDGEYAYPLPANFAAPIFVNGEYNDNVRRVGGYLIFTTENPDLTYVVDKLDFDNWIYPDDYGYLVAYKLAMEIWGNVAPDSKAYEQAVQKYGLVLQQLRNAEIKIKRKKNPSPMQFVY